MLAIRRAQIDVLEEEAIRVYGERAIAELWQELPFECADRGIEEMRVLVREGVARAAKNGFSTEANVYCFVRMMLLLGRDFDEQPWAIDALQDCAAEHENDRLDYLALAAERQLP